MLRIQGLSVGYGESQILWDVHLHVPEGQVVCLMGRNGVGKTTLLKSVMGLLAAQAGTIMFDGQDITRMRPEQRSRRGMGYVPQGREIFPQLTVRENLGLGLLAKNGRQGKVPDTGVPALSSAVGLARPQRWVPERWPTAATGDRSGVGDRAETLAPG